MANSHHPWSLKGVTPTARAAAKQAAADDGVTLGVWLTRVIRDVAAGQGISESDIVVKVAPRAVIPAPQYDPVPPRPLPSRPSSIERLMRRNGGAPVQAED